MKAFPTTADFESYKVHYQGMDLRDYFAAKAMQVVKCSDYKTTAEYCYLLADLMMKARDGDT